MKGLIALAVNLAVYGWLGALVAYSSEEASRDERLVYLFIAGIFTLLATLPAARNAQPLRINDSKPARRRHRVQRTTVLEGLGHQRVGKRS